MTFAGLVNRHQADVIAYLVEENRVLKEQMKGRKLRLNDDQRRRLAAKAKLLGRKALNQVATIVTPDTLMRWHRLIAVPTEDPIHPLQGPPERGLKHGISITVARPALRSALGYMRDHWEELTLFLREEGAPLDNNAVERRSPMHWPECWRSKRGTVVRRRRGDGTQSGSGGSPLRRIRTASRFFAMRLDGSQSGR